MPWLLKSPTKEPLQIEDWLGATASLDVLAEEKNLMPLPGFEPQIIWPVALAAISSGLF
jgi:hypothetical protein